VQARQTIAGTADHQSVEGLQFQENVLLAEESIGEADILRQQMARDLVAIAMRRLTSLK
jgi:hypothetical protein